MPNASLHPPDLIIGTALITAETVASELRSRLAARLSGHWLTEQELIALARNTLAEFEPILAENLANADLAAWIAGFDAVAKKLPEWAKDQFAFGAGFRPPSDPPRFPSLLGAFGEDEPELRFPLIEKAADSLFERRILTPEQFRSAAATFRREAFTVASEARPDVLERIRDTLAETVQEGASLRVFREKLGDELEKSFIGPGHLETVYRTNVQQAFSEGHDRLASNPIVEALFPYQAYLPIRDARTRETHAMLAELGIDGTNIYRRDDPFWDYFTPAWEYNCRCGVNLLSIEKAARRGVKEAQEWLDTGRKPPLQSRLPYIPFRPPVGFERRRRIAA
jgi:hypothetical protein